MATTRDLTGTYGQTGVTGTADDISMVIRKNSYCAGTRDDDLVIVPTVSSVSFYGVFSYQIGAPTNSIIDYVLEIPGKPNVKGSVLSQFDPYGSNSGATIEGTSSGVVGNINLKIVSVNNYPLIQNAPSIEVIDTGAPIVQEPGIYVYLDKNETEIGTPLTGTITLTDLIVDGSYTVIFRNILTDEIIVGINEFLDAISFIATSETMSIPFSVNSTLFTNLETLVLASIVSNIPEPPSDIS